ncbi:MAG: peptidoglycan editing factor PgeF [Deltaproteobacteria bacterium]|nr:peptidoglycan editing factor PgeF [Deltaproteobacteria bacterium]
MDLVFLKVPRWEKRDGLLHGFLGRRGGKSVGPYAGLNLSFRVGDDPQVVKDNLCDVKRAVGVHDLRIVTMKQVHGEHIVDVKDKSLKEAGEADGMVTEEGGLFLGILTADCVPILFSVSGRKLVAVVHAGWRGTVAGIVVKMVHYLKDRYDVEPESLEAAMGPAIGPCCYEVGAEVSVPLVQRWGELGERCLQARGGKNLLDLSRLNVSLLEEAGIPSEQIFQIGSCTSCAAEEFFSYRRGGRETGRQMSFIGWQ